MSLSTLAKNTLWLFERSPKDDDGWASCSNVAMGVVIKNIPPELIEIDEENSRIRLTHDGAVVLRYL